MKKNYPIVKKAYEIVLSRLDEGFLSDTIMCHAENVNQAKKILLDMVKYDGWKLRYGVNDDEINYLTIPVIRRKEDDIVLFEDKEIIKSKIEPMLRNRERLKELNDILDNPNITHCYIYKGAYYRPNSCGYTALRTEAGIYTKQEAVFEAKAVREIVIIPIDPEEHNKLIMEKIEELNGKLISV